MNARYTTAMLYLYLLRHGQTDLSKANVFCGASSNPGLTDDGRTMAGAFAGAFTRAYAGLAWEGIFTSPLLKLLADRAHLHDRLKNLPGT